MSDRIAVMRGGTIVAMLPGRADAEAVMAALPVAVLSTMEASREWGKGFG